MPATAMVDALIEIARSNVECGCGCTGIGSDKPSSVKVPVVRETGTARAFDLEGIEMLADMWGARRLPRDEGAAKLKQLGIIEASAV